MSIDEIEDLISYNLSCGIAVEKTLHDINKMELLDFFISGFYQ